MKKTYLPTISVVVATHNSARTIGRCLQSIRSQDYPQELIEIIVADGASVDHTKEIAKQYEVRWMAIPAKRQNAEYNKSIGIAAARHTILAMIDHDNVLPHRSWLAGMVRPFREPKEVVGVETIRYHYDPKTSLLDRYFALFGAGDPIVWYLGKADRLSYLFDQPPAAWQVKDCGSYYLVRFTVDNMPTIGANGFLVRRRLLLQHAEARPGKYFDMDVNIDLIRRGFATYALVKDSILHLTGEQSVWNFLKRRLLFLTQYRFGTDAERIRRLRRYGNLSARDKLRLLWAIISCATLVIPLYDSIRGWRKIKDRAWFLHPLLCVSFLAIYGYAVGKKLLAK